MTFFRNNIHSFMKPSPNTFAQLDDIHFSFLQQFIFISGASIPSFLIYLSLYFLHVFQIYQFRSIKQNYFLLLVISFQIQPINTKIILYYFNY